MKRNRTKTSTNGDGSKGSICERYYYRIMPVLLVSGQMNFMIESKESSRIEETKTRNSRK